VERPDDARPWRGDHRERPAAKPRGRQRQGGAQPPVERDRDPGGAEPEEAEAARRRGREDPERDRGAEEEEALDPHLGGVNRKEAPRLLLGPEGGGVALAARKGAHRQHPGEEEEGVGQRHREERGAGVAAGPALWEISRRFIHKIIDSINDYFMQ